MDTLESDERVRDVMTLNPVAVMAESSIRDAALQMAEHNVGTVIVLKDDGTLCGLVSDRDIVVRAVAEGKDAYSTAVREVCTHDLTVVKPDALVNDAIHELRGRAVRRLPVVENNRVVGILSLGDLALDRDPDSVLAEISAAPPNS